MLESLMLAAGPAQETTTAIHPLWSFLGGPVVGAAVATGVLALVNTIAGKKVKPVNTIQSQTQALLDGLEKMVSLMTEDKAKDAERIKLLQDRVDEMETASMKDLDTISRLHAEIQVLRAESARKDVTIRLLAAELRALGTIAHGLSEDVQHSITFERRQDESIED